MGAPVTCPRGQEPAGAAEDCAVRLLVGRDSGDEGGRWRELGVMQSICWSSCRRGGMRVMSLDEANSSAWLWVQSHGVIPSGNLLAAVLMMRRVEPVMTLVGWPAACMRAWWCQIWDALLFFGLMVIRKRQQRRRLERPSRASEAVFFCRVVVSTSDRRRPSFFPSSLCMVGPVGRWPLPDLPAGTRFDSH